MNESISQSWNPTGIKNKSEFANMTTNCFNRSIFENVYFFIFISINYEIFDVFIVFFIQQEYNQCRCDHSYIVIIFIYSSLFKLNMFDGGHQNQDFSVQMYYCQPRKVLFVVKSIPSDYRS